MKREKIHKPYSAVPQPKKIPLLGTILDFTKFRNFEPTKLHELVKQRHDKLGPIYKEPAIPGKIQLAYFYNA